MPCAAYILCDIGYGRRKDQLRVKDAGTGLHNGHVIVCRCEGITVADVQSAIRQRKVRSINAVKKVTRAGMGPCQGHTCAPLIERVLEQEAQVPPGAEMYVARPPVRGVLMATLAAAADLFETPTGSVSAAVLWGRSEGEATVSLDSDPDE